MSIGIIVSYDGTPNDDDALPLARAFARAGAKLALAYVRHAPEFDPDREELAQHDAEHRLEQGAASLGDASLPKHVVLSGSTGEGLGNLAESEQAAMIVFGSDYRTAPGRVEPGTSAQRLLEGGPVAIAIAAAGLRTRQDGPIKSISVLAPEIDDAAPQTAQALAEKLGLASIESDHDEADLVVVGSHPTAGPGRVALSGLARTQLSLLRSSVLVVPHGRPVPF